MECHSVKFSLILWLIGFMDDDDDDGDDGV